MVQRDAPFDKPKQLNPTKAVTPWFSGRLPYLRGGQPTRAPRTGLALGRILRQTERELE